MTPKISVIVPVYKAEKYLHRCVDSILAQTFQDFEVLLIDDGSPDKSGDICDEYAKKDNRVRVFHKENGGVTSARKLGVENSVGKYILFVDSDDSLPKNAILILMSRMTSDVDIVMGAWKKYFNNSNRLILLGIRGILGTYSYTKALLNSKVYTGPVGKLFRRNLFTEEVLNIPHHITNNEDLIMNLKIAKKIRNIHVLPTRVVYHYHDNCDSASTKFMPLKSWDDAFGLILTSVDYELHKYVYSYMAKILYKHGRKMDISKSAYYLHLQNVNLTFEGRLYMRLLFNNNIRNRIILSFLYIRQLFMRGVNTLLG